MPQNPAIAGLQGLPQGDPRAFLASKKVPPVDPNQPFGQLQNHNEQVDPTRFPIPPEPPDYWNQLTQVQPPEFEEPEQPTSVSGPAYGQGFALEGGLSNASGLIGNTGQSPMTSPETVYQTSMPDVTPTPSGQQPEVMMNPFGPGEANPGPSPEYVVQAGDSLWSIAAKNGLGGPEWPKLYALNKDVIGPDPNRIYPGTKLRLS